MADWRLGWRQEADSRYDFYTNPGGRHYTTNDGQLRCWGKTREWGVGPPRPKATTQQRALSLKTCGDSRENWDGWMRVTLTMKDGRKLENRLKGKYDEKCKASPTTGDCCDLPTPSQRLGFGLHQPGLETSMVFDPGDSDSHDRDSVQKSIAEEELESVTLKMSGTCWAVCIEQVIYEADVLVQGAPFWLDDRESSLPDCKRLRAKGRAKCYVKTRTLQVSRARLELQFCAEQDQVAKLATQEPGEARLQFRGIRGSGSSSSRTAGEDEDEDEHETIKTVWKPSETGKPSQPEPTDQRLVTAFQRVPEKVEIVLDSENSTMKTICISEVALGLHSHRVVLAKSEFFVGNPKPDPCPPPQTPQAEREEQTDILQATVCREDRVKNAGSEIKPQVFTATRKLKLVYNSDNGLCLSDVRTLVAEAPKKNKRTRRVWTLVPFWLDTCKEEDAYYDAGGSEGKLKCWGKDREFYGRSPSCGPVISWPDHKIGAGAEHQRAVSFSTCLDEKQTWTSGNLKVNVTTKEGAALAKAIPYGNSDWQIPKYKEHQAGEASVVLDTDVATGEGGRSIAEEQLDALTLSLEAVQGVGGDRGLCTSRIVYETIVLNSREGLQ
eukprot:g9474.t1